MNVSLTPEIEQYVSAKVESGRYNSASEVVREAGVLAISPQISFLQVTSRLICNANQPLPLRIAAMTRGLRLP